MITLPSPKLFKSIISCGNTLYLSAISETLSPEITVCVIGWVSIVSGGILTNPDKSVLATLVSLNALAKNLLEFSSNGNDE